MTIVSGEVYKVETLNQLINRTTFSRIDVLRSTADEMSIVERYNKIHSGNEYFDGPVDSLEEMDENDIAEEFAELDTYEAIMKTLRESERDWVHLYDGTIHTIVELF